MIHEDSSIFPDDRPVLLRFFERKRAELGNNPEKSPIEFSKSQYEKFKDCLRADKANNHEKYDIRIDVDNLIDGDGVHLVKAIFHNTRYDIYWCENNSDLEKLYFLTKDSAIKHARYVYINLKKYLKIRIIDKNVAYRLYNRLNRI